MSVGKVHCLYCGKKIGELERFIVGKDDEIYCGECVEEDSITIYSVMGEIIGDERDTEEYNSIERFEKSLKNEIKDWEFHLKRWENTNGEGAEQRKEFYKNKIRLAKEKYKKYFE